MRARLRINGADHSPPASEDQLVTALPDCLPPPFLQCLLQLEPDSDRAPFFVPFSNGRAGLSEALAVTDDVALQRPNGASRTKIVMRRTNAESRLASKCRDV